MKKFVSIMLVFAALASMLSLTSFAADIDINGALGAVAEEINAISTDFMNIEGLYEFFDGIDIFLESVIETIIDFVVQIMDTFTF